MARKKTNLAASADVTTKQELLALADAVGPEICVLKTHMDIIADFDEDLLVQLRALAAKHEFLIFEDRKFADIGNTVKLQYSSGVHHIADWAQITNAHTLAGPGVVEGLKTVGKERGHGLLLLAQMSSKGNLLNDAYTKATVELAQAHRDFVIGFICQECVVDEPTFVYMTPGVKIQPQGDGLGQQYRTPRVAIVEQGNDVIIVGRGIYQADDPAAAAREYRQQAWAAYEEVQQ